MHYDYDGWPPTTYHWAQNTPSRVQSGCTTIYLAVSAPLVTLQGRCAFQNVAVFMQHTGLPSSGLVELCVRQIVCVFLYSLYKILYYTCNIGYTARWACLAFRLAPTLFWAVNTRLTTCTVHIGPLCVGFCLQRNLADLIEGACRLPPLRPLLCNHQTIYKTWQAHKEARQRPGAWHLNLHEALPFGGQVAKVGGAWV